jgi:hypothetical protein
MENNAKRLEPTDKNKGSKIRDNAWNKSSDKKREKRAATAAIAPQFFLSSAGNIFPEPV